MVLGYSSNKFAPEKKGLAGRLKALLRFFANAITAPIRYLIRMVVWTSKLIYEGWKTRQWKHLLFGLPTLLVAGMSIYFVIGGRVSAVSDRGNKYLSAGNAAASRKDWKSAKLFLERAVELGSNNPGTLYNLARAAEATSDSAQMLAIVEQLAPSDKAVYAPAHLWRAVKLLTRKPLQSSDLDLAEKHLQLTLRLNESNQQAHALLGDLYFQKGVLDAAILHLDQTPPNSSKYRLMLAKALDAQGDTERTKRVAESVLKFAETASRNSPQDVPLRLDYAEASLILKQYPQTAEILRQGLLLGESAGLRDALTMTFIKWSDSVIEASPDNRRAAFSLIAAGLENTPHEILLFDRLLNLLKGSDEVAIDVQKFLEENITSGTATGVSHLVLGTALYELGNVTEADFHLERAFKLVPSSPIVANNFAWHLIKQSPADPKRALQIIDAALRQQPDEPELHDTRGHILVQLAQWKEAIEELEPLLEKLPGRVATHEALAEAYAQLQMQELSNSHRLRAEKLKNSEIPGDP